MRILDTTLSILITITILFSIINRLHALDNTRRADDKSSPEYSAGKILKFTGHLISIDEYYRAYVELLRLKSYYPNYLRESQYYVTELFLLFKGERYHNVIHDSRTFGDKKLQAIGIIFKTDSYLEESEYIRAGNLVKNGSMTGTDNKLDTYIYKRMVLSHLLMGEIDRAFEIIGREVPGTGGPGTAGGIIADRDFKDAIGFTRDTFRSLKSPWVGLSLGIVPGLGYGYAGEKETGIVAFIAISLFSALTYYAFSTDNKEIGIFLGAITSFFYGGNIIGGYMASNRYNNSAMSDLEEYLYKDMDLAGDRQDIFNRYGIGNGK